MTKIKLLILVLWSFARYGDAPLEIYQKRREVCRNCPKWEATATNIYCGACGCPRWPLADLRTKWRMRDLKCPLEKW